jgi:hypothetical protein
MSLHNDEALERIQELVFKHDLRFRHNARGGGEYTSKDLRIKIHVPALSDQEDLEILKRELLRFI